MQGAVGAAVYWGLDSGLWSRDLWVGLKLHDRESQNGSLASSAFCLIAWPLRLSLIGVGIQASSFDLNNWSKRDSGGFSQHHC